MSNERRQLSGLVPISSASGQKDRGTSVDAMHKHLDKVAACTCTKNAAFLVKFQRRCVAAERLGLGRLSLSY